MNEPLISIIVPVYNATAYLDTCLSSILKQTVSDWEAICINDGSTDGSLDILHRYAGRDSRIRVLDQSNSGVSAARNRGIAEARGRYLCMVDSDDELPDNALAHLSAPVQQDGDLDFVIGNTLWLMEEAGGIRPIVRTPLVYKADKTGMIEDSVYLAMHTSGLPSAKLYKKDLFNRYELRYNTGIRIGEDHELTLRFLMHVKRAYVVPDIVYHYMIRGSSAMGKFRAGLLELQDYLTFPASSLRVARFLPTEMRTDTKRQYAQVLAFYFLRDFTRGFNALWYSRPKVAHKLLRKALLKWIAAKPHLHGASLRRAWQQMHMLEPKLRTVFENMVREDLKHCPLIIPLLYLKRMFKKR